MKLTRTRAVALMKALGQRNPQKWSGKRLQGKVDQIASTIDTVEIDELNEADAKTLRRILKVQNGGGQVVVTADDDSGETEEVTPKEKKARKKSVKKVEEEPAEEPAEEPIEEPEETPAEEPPAPKKKKASKKAKKETVKKPAAKKAPRRIHVPATYTRSATAGKKVGVIKTIAAILEEGPIVKTDLLDRLCNEFPDRPRESLQSTMNAQCPTRLRKAGHNLQGNHKEGFFIKTRKKAAKKSKKSKKGE